MGKLGSPLTGNFKRYLEGSGKGTSLFAGALLGGLLSGDPEGYGEEGSGDRHYPIRVCSPGTPREPGRGGSFARSPEDYERKALGMGISLYGGSVGQPGVSLSTGDFEIWLKGALKVECLSLSVGVL